MESIIKFIFRKTYDVGEDCSKDHQDSPAVSRGALGCWLWGLHCSEDWQPSSPEEQLYNSNRKFQSLPTCLPCLSFVGPQMSMTRKGLGCPKYIATLFRGNDLFYTEAEAWSPVGIWRRDMCFDEFKTRRESLWFPDVLYPSGHEAATPHYILIFPQLFLKPISGESTHLENWELDGELGLVPSRRSQLWQIRINLD